MVEVQKYQSLLCNIDIQVQVLERFRRCDELLGGGVRVAGRRARLRLHQAPGGQGQGQK